MQVLTRVRGKRRGFSPGSTLVSPLQRQFLGALAVKFSVPRATGDWDIFATTCRYA